ncbi:MAG: hypothetical protein FWG15_03655 [Propionibacteriaceae bacterium]|nr:hypothetical protein [Propionibacteriaceae bacterium]
MCRPVPCHVCGKTTWAGCGQHIASVKATVPTDQWCGGKHTEEEIAAAKPEGFFSRMFNR